MKNFYIQGYLYLKKNLKMKLLALNQKQEDVFNSAVKFYKFVATKYENLTQQIIDFEL